MRIRNCIYNKKYFLRIHTMLTYAKWPACPDDVTLSYFTLIDILSYGNLSHFILIGI